MPGHTEQFMQPAPPENPDATPPPAAVVVSEGNLTDESLAAELDETKRKLRDAEIRVSELEDQVHTLKSIPTAPEKRDWLAGGTFFHGRA